MNWKQTVPTTYLVRWPDGIYKAGFSTRQRWRAFVLRGAEVLRLQQHPTEEAAFALEAEWDEHLARHGSRAFGSAAEAVGSLGHRGDGYLECWSVDSSIAPGMLDALPERVI